MLKFYFGIVYLQNCHIFDKEIKNKAMTTYNTTEIKVLGNTFSVLIASGNSNYVSIRKETNNPYKGAGREFKNLTEASNHYKSPEMKIALLEIELNN